MKKFVSKSFLGSKSSPPKAESKTTIHPKARKTVFGLFGKTASAIHTFGILGIVGSLDTYDSGWMVTDYATWTFIVSQMKGYAGERSVWRTIRPIDQLFPDGFVTFGEAGCDRLQLPLPSTFHSDLDPAISADDFKTECLFSLREMARKVKPAEKLILLLIAHSDLGTGEFRFLITTKSNSRFGEASFTKRNLELAVRPCRGEIIVICNLCYSGNLASERWTLLCPATSQETVDSDALSQARAGCFRGSAFTACVVAQAAHEHGLRVPLQQAEPRPGTGGDSQQVALPPCPPLHSFSAPVPAQLSILKPSNVSFKKFTRRMLDIQQFLVENSLGLFQSRLLISWTSESPSQPSGGGSRPNPTAVTASEGPQGRPLSTLGSQSPRFDPLLVKLATAMPEMNQADQSHTPGAFYAKICANFRLHMAQPDRVASPFQANTIDEPSLLLALISMHIQAIAVQKIAQQLGWCNATDGVVPSFPEKIANWDISDMIERGGVRVDKLPKILQRHFPKLRLGMDRNSVLWLSVQWATAGRPVIQRPQWDKLMEDVGDMTKREALYADDAGVENEHGPYL